MSDIGTLVDLSARFLRPPVRWGSDPASLVFDPPLTPAEATLYGQLQDVVAYGLTHVDPALLVRLWPQIAACAAVATLGPGDADYTLDAAFVANATPTTTDAVAALKALIRINARTIAAQQALIEIVRLMFVAGARA